MKLATFVVDGKPAELHYDFKRQKSFVHGDDAIKAMVKKWDFGFDNQLLTSMISSDRACLAVIDMENKNVAVVKWLETHPAFNTIENTVI